MDTASATEIDGDMPPYPLRANNGYEWDTFSFSADIHEGDEWMCVQIESVDTTPPYTPPPPNKGMGESALFLAAGFVLPVPGAGTPGYWKNHPEAWPVNRITTGGVTYTKDEAIEIMNKPVKGDKTYTMFDSLVAAKLNVLIGNPSGCIDGTIAAADGWMTTYPLGCEVKASSNAWTVGEPLHMMLDDYNNGLLCAPPRD